MQKYMCVYARATGKMLAVVSMGQRFESPFVHAEQLFLVLAGLSLCCILGEENT